MRKLKTPLQTHCLLLLALGFGLLVSPVLHATEHYAENASGTISPTLFPLPEKEERTITGTVVDDENQEPLIGVNVLVQGTGTGTITDIDGHFSLDVPDDATTLVFSYTGYAPKEVDITGATQFTVSLELSTTGLDEVIVVGYSSTSQRDLTSAVVSLEAQELNKRVATNPTQLLQGKLPGLQIVQNSGEPGNENFQMQIRGRGTFSGAGSNPLVIVDGLPGDLSSINPNDIESVSVLKDAASSAIYGSRGANGVIVVTTKKGNGQPLSLELNTNLGITTANRLPEFVTNSAEYMDLFNEALANVGAPPRFQQDDIDIYRNATDRDMYPNYDWTDEMFQTALVSNVYLSASGSGEKTNFNVSLGYTSQPGVFRGFDFDKYTTQISLSTKVSDRITFGVNSLLRYDTKEGPRQGPTDQFLSTLAAIPLVKPQLPDGRFVGSGLGGSYNLGNKNPVAIYNTTLRETESFYGQAQLFLNVELIDGLFWETRGGFNYGQSKDNDFRPTIPLYDYHTGNFAYNLDVGSTGLSVRDETSRHTTVYSQLRLDKTFGPHKLDAIAGWQQEYDKYEDFRGGRRGFPTNALRELNAGPSAGQTNSGSAGEWAMRSYYGTANYAFNDRYLLGTSLRYDGTSRLPEDSRWGLFYSFSAGWRITGESFMQDVVWLDHLKLRASWGELGNQNIGLYPYQSTLSQTQYSFGGSTMIGFRPGGLVDPSLTWETTRILDFGIDGSLFNYKLNFSADYYVKTTYDILRGSQVPEYIGLAAPTVNNGTMENRGFEIAVDYTNSFGNGFTYTIGGNIDSYKNKLVEFGADEIGGQTIKTEGLEYDQYYMFEWEGIFQSEEEVQASADQTGVGPLPAPGDLKLKDQNGDGVINQEDRVLMKGQFPSMNYAFNLGFGWKNFDMSAFFFGSSGRKIYVTGWGIEPFRQGSVPTTDWRDRWTADNPSTTMPRIYSADYTNAISGYTSSYFLRDASFLRLKNLQMGYTLPANFFGDRNIPLQSLRLYFSADNLLTWSSYPGLDPERISGGAYVSYPQVKVFTFGLDVKF